MKYTRDIYTKCIVSSRIRLNASQSSLKLLVCSSVPDNLSIGNSMELCMKVLLNCIRSPLFASLRIDRWTVLRYEISVKLLYAFQ